MAVCCSRFHGRTSDGRNHRRRGSWCILSRRRLMLKLSSLSRPRAAICNHRLRMATFWQRLRDCARCFRRATKRATKKISREHAIVIEHENLVTVIGGKWTTYRKMALDAIDQAKTIGLLAARPCTTAR